MFCNECGANLPDGSKFCNVCGAKLIVPQMSEHNAQPDYVQQYQTNAQPDYGQQYQTNAQPDNGQQYQTSAQPDNGQQYQQNYVPESQPSSADSGKQKKASKKKLPTWAKVWIAVCVLAVIGIGTFLTIHFIKGKKSGGSYASTNGTSNNITKEDEANDAGKMTTEDYEELDNVNVDVPEPQQDIADGVNLFDTEPVPVEPWEISISDLPEYDALVSFFNQMDIYRDGNYERYYDSEQVLSGNFDLLYHLVSPFICVDRSGLYPLYDLETVWGEVEDPRGYISDENSSWYMGGYNHVSLEGLKWVAVNIFNVKEGDYDILLNKLLEDDMSYIENGRLYYSIGGIGWLGDLFEIESVKTDGTFYYITYNKVPDPEYGFDEEIETYEAKMQLKNIDGVNYWSMYYNHKVE